MRVYNVFPRILILAILLAACGGEPAPKPATVVPTEVPTLAPPTQVPTEAPATAPAYEPATVKMNDSNRASFAPIYIAKAEGFFTEFGIDLELVDFNKNDEAIPLVDAGQLDAFAGGPNTALLNVIAQGGNIQVVADRGHISPDDPCTYLALIMRKELIDSGEVTGPADLAGRNISVTITGSTGFFMSAYLAQANLTLDDLVVVKLPSGSYADGLTNKSIDGVVVMEPDLTRFTSDGTAAVLARSEDVLGVQQQSVLAFGKRLLKDDRELGVRFLAAYLKGVEQYNQGKTERNLQIIADAMEVDTATIQNQCWVQIRADGKIDFAGVDPIQQWMIEGGDLDQAVTEEQFWDPTLLQDAQKLLQD